LNVDILNGTKTFRDAFKEMLDSVCENGHSFPSVVEYLRKGTRLLFQDILAHHGPNLENQCTD